MGGINLNFTFNGEEVKIYGDGKIFFGERVLFYHSINSWNESIYWK